MRFDIFSYTSFFIF